MVDTKKIIEKIQNGLKECSVKHSIPAKDVQLKISSTGVVSAMNAAEKVGDVDVLKLFKISAMENIIFPITPYLKKTLFLLAKKRNLDQIAVNARIFTKSADFSPCVYLHEGDKVIGEITITELLETK